MNNEPAGYYFDINSLKYHNGSNYLFIHSLIRL